MMLSCCAIRRKHLTAKVFEAEEVWKPNKVKEAKAEPWIFQAGSYTLGRLSHESLH